MLAESLQCECNPGKIYSSASTFRTHKASKRHQDWEQKGEERQLRKRLGEAEAEVAKMHQKVHELETGIADIKRSVSTRDDMSVTLYVPRARSKNTA